jgi:hypothetical protein
MAHINKKEKKAPLSDKSKIKPKKCSILKACGAGNRVRTT